MSPHRLGKSVQDRGNQPDGPPEFRRPGPAEFRENRRTLSTFAIIGQSSFLQLVARLLQQCFRSGRMAFHVPLVCTLGVTDAVVGLVTKPLSIGENRVSTGADVVLWALGDCDAGDGEAQA
jgi:hypothetical protein